MKKVSLMLLVLLCTTAVYAQTGDDALENRIAQLEQRMVTLEIEVAKVVQLNARLQKVANFGQPITESVEECNSITYKLLSVEEGKDQGSVILTLSMVTDRRETKFQSYEMHIVNLYGERVDVSEIYIGGQKIIAYELKKDVPILLKAVFDVSDIEKWREIKLFAFENIGNFGSFDTPETLLYNLQVSPAR
ncbi:MAG: hypothetical protein Q4E10_01395 [Porphyromonas sp.]|nr:hypothetical protein [Porphyromonas sp.]